MTSTGAGSRTVVLARLGRPRGLKGEIRLKLETDRPEEVLGPGRHTLDDGRVIEVEELVDHGGACSWIVAGRPPPEILSRYTNASVVVDAATLPPREDGAYSEFQLVGLRVVDPCGRPLGVFERVEHRYEIETWIFRDAEGREHDVPAVSDYVKSVDLEKGEIVMETEAAGL